MAQILRLRGANQIYEPRSWSLFRLAHHRLVGVICLGSIVVTG
jgi:hypothetical protein